MKFKIHHLIFQHLLVIFIGINTTLVAKEVDQLSLQCSLIVTCSMSDEIVVNPTYNHIPTEITFVAGGSNREKFQNNRFYILNDSTFKTYKENNLLIKSRDITYVIITDGVMKENDLQQLIKSDYNVVTINRPGANFSGAIDISLSQYPEVLSDNYQLSYELVFSIDDLVPTEDGQSRLRSLGKSTHYINGMKSLANGFTHFLKVPRLMHELLSKEINDQKKINELINEAGIYCEVKR